MDFFLIFMFSLWKKFSFFFRGVPTQNDLVKIAKGICASDDDALELMATVFNDLAKGYCHLYETQDREFFGLRDFYSLVKMLFR